jgi:nicotinamidase-related amidase
VAGADKDTAPGNTGLILIDVINAMDFDTAGAVAPSALAAADKIVALRSAADAAGVPVVYVNDNFGQWRSDRSRIVDYCRYRNETACKLVETLAPRDEDYFIIKPQFSGFYSTNLPVLLPKLGVSRLIVTGIAADICVLFTAADAHMRDYELWVPSDCVAGEQPDHIQWALQIMRKSMDAETRPTDELSLRDWIAKVRRS